MLVSTRDRLRRVPLWLCSATLALSAVASPPTNYELVFEDEFTGSSLDPSIWHIDEGARKDAINVADAIEVSNGQLTISTWTEDNQTGTANDVHHTGFITTNDLFLHPFGYFEASIRFDQGATGAWHAFWLMPGGSTPIWGTPDAETGAEIDIIEYRYTRKVTPIDLTADMHCALHWNGYYGGHQKTGTDPDPQPLNNGDSLMDGQFHTYAVLWTPEKYEFYFDGTKVWETTDGLSFAYSNIILSSEVASNVNWAGVTPEGGYGAKGASTNPKFTVEYVRVYNLKDSVSGQAAFNSDPIPGTLEAENFDVGGKGVAYYDKSDSGPGTNTTYRSGEDVDIDADASASNGYYVSEPSVNEWLEYTISTTQPGYYSASVDIARVQDTSDNSDNGMMLFYANGEQLGLNRTDDTGGWTSFATQSIPSYLYLQSGDTFTVRFENSRDINFDAIHFDYLGTKADAREGESATLSGPTIIGSELCSGSQFITGFGSTTTVHTAQFDNVDGFNDGGDVTMTLRYSWYNTNVNKTTGVKVKVNGAYLQNNGSDLLIPFVSTGSWNHWKNITLTLPNMLAGANNTVILESNAISNQNIRVDSVIFTRDEPLPVTGGGQITTIEAEDSGNIMLGNPGNEAYVATHANASYGAYVKGLNKSNAGVEFPSITAGSGQATITIYYANGSGASSNKALEVNGVSQDVTFPATSSLTDFSGSVQATVTLTGSDNIKIYRKHNDSTDGAALRIDYIVIETTATASIDEYTEAEGLEFGQAIQGTHANASNGAYVDRFNKSASGIEWIVTAPADMQATLTIGYGNGTGSESLKMLNVNGVDTLLTFPTTTGWNDYSGVFQMTIDLQAGSNVIKLWRDGAGIDSLRVDWLSLSN
ncbi:family 16 glycosylhydrolase [Cerasicoccus maritimus]|uniref:family 16 glycosylhydrolase n=1 Tax=Cerasicoccus maritimus TaxID=490089 RepID=UPI00285279FD|nr:family 16 glycosylhydrolase [Cerasicoccus maritimus]